MTRLLRPIGALGSSNCTAILGRRTFLLFLPTFLCYRWYWGANPCASASFSGGARCPQLRRCSERPALRPWLARFDLQFDDVCDAGVLLLCLLAMSSSSSDTQLGASAAAVCSLL